MRENSFTNAIVSPTPLYHGTDKKIIDYSEEERNEIQRLCVEIADFCYRIFCEDGMSIWSPSAYKMKHFSAIGDCWPYFISACQRYYSRINNSSLYQYGSVYLTGDRQKAELYARRAFIMGEQGDVAYWLYNSASRIWDIKKDNPEMSDQFKRFENLTKLPHIPVIITFDNVLLDDLLSEKGEEIDWDNDLFMLSACSFRLKPNSSISLKDGRIECLKEK